MQLAYLTII
jgi:hypothetical protein